MDTLLDAFYCLLVPLTIAVLIHQRIKGWNWTIVPYIWFLGVLLARVGLDAYSRTGLLSVVPAWLALAAASLGVAIAAWTMIHMWRRWLHGAYPMLGQGQPPIFGLFMCGVLSSNLRQVSDFPYPFTVWLGLAIFGGLAPMLLILVVVRRSVRQRRDSARLQGCSH